MAVGIIAPVAAEAGSPSKEDAELIQLCAGLVKVGDAQRAMYTMKGLTLDEEEAQGPELKRLADEEDCLTDAVTDTRLPRSLAGASALARAIMAISEIEDGGNLAFEHENSTTLATLLCRVLAETKVVL